MALCNVYLDNNQTWSKGDLGLSFMQSYTAFFMVKGDPGLCFLSSTALHCSNSAQTIGPNLQWD